MVYLQEMSHQCQINKINASYNKFEISLVVNVLNVLVFLLLTSEENGGDSFLICNFFSDLYLLFRWSWYMVTAYGIFFYDLFKCLRFLKGCLNAIFQFPSHLQENLEKKHTHTPDFFSLKNHGFFLNQLFSQFNSRINRGFYFGE